MKFQINKSPYMLVKILFNSNYSLFLIKFFVKLNKIYIKLYKSRVIDSIGLFAINCG